MTEDCDSLEFKSSQNAEIRTAAPQECCDTETVRRIPDELRNPPPTPPTTGSTIELLTPKPINIYNHRQTAVCEAEGTEGEIVVTEEGTFTTRFYFSSVLSITENVLQYIARSGKEATVEKLIHDGTITDRAIRTLTGMTLVQAREFIEAAMAIQQQQDDYAKEAAQAKLVCEYWNSEQVATCDDTQMAQPDQDPEAIYRAIIPAKRYSSTVSQEEADSLAYQAAKALLVCFYLNDEVEVDCRTRPGRPMDQMEEVPNDVAPIYPGRDKRVGKAKVPAGMHRSWQSKEDANQRALEVGYSLLNCWYPNDVVYLECEDPDARNYGVSHNGTNPAVADIERKKPGQRVTVPYGYFTSELSTDAATEEARLLAESLLECCYANNAMRFTCAAEEVTLWDGSTTIISPERNQGTYEVVIQEGQFFSCNSQEEADLFAEQSAEGLLECYYCNQRVMPTCVPQWITEGVLDGTIHLPLGEIISNGNYTVNLADLPPEATVGAPSGAYCDTSAQQAQDIASAAAGAKASGAIADCIYVNDAVFVCCAGRDPFTGEELAPGVPHMRVHPSTGEPYIFYTMYSSTACVANEFSRPSSGEYISAPAGMFSMPGADKKDECNQRAIDFAMSALTCVWANPPTWGICTATNYMNSLCDSQWTLGKGLSDWGGQLVDWSNTKDRPVYIPRGYAMYVGAGNDEDEAYLTILSAMNTFGQSMIMCVYTNRLQIYDCNDLPDGPVGKRGNTYVNNGSYGQIAPDTVYAESPTEADYIAAEMARSMAACDLNTVIVNTYPDIPPPEEPGVYSSVSSPGGGGSTPPPSSSKKEEPTPPPQPPGDECCYSDCPQFQGAQSPTSLNLSEIEAIIKNVHDIMQRLDEKADAVKTHADQAIAEANA